MLGRMRLPRLRSLWFSLRDSLWFVPTLLVLAGVALAVLLIELPGDLTSGLSQRWPRLFGAGAEGSRGMLSAIATSMITVAGVVFSITVVALSLASSQYSPRLLRNFMADRPTQVVLGAFVAIFAYCLIVLRTIRGADEGAFVPSLAVLGGIAMAFVGVGLLIYYIHHIASAIQVASIVTRITDDTTRAIDRLFPSELGTGLRAGGSRTPPDSVPDAWTALPAPRTGYLVGVDGERLLELACKHSTVLRIEGPVGGFLVAGRPLAHVCARQAIDAQACAEILDCFSIDAERTVHQDAPYGLQQLVDVALKALSPGINDPTTAVACIDQLGALVVRLGDRHFEGPYRAVDGRLRLIAVGPDYASMVALAFDAITDHAAPDAQVYAKLIATLDSVAAATRDADKRRALLAQLDVMLAQIVHAKLAPQRQAPLLREGALVRARWSAPPS